MAAYGLYTHIASNKFRSMLLLAGLFLLLYVLVYAGALIAEVLIDSGQTVAFYLSRAFSDLLKASPFATIAAAAWIVIAYFFHQSMIDAVTGGHALASNLSRASGRNVAIGTSGLTTDGGPRTGPWRAVLLVGLGALDRRRGAFACRQ